MSFLKTLFGGGKSNTSGGPDDASARPVGEPVEHQGFTIVATPFSEGGQYQTCGVITREVGGSVKEHRFIRADRFNGEAEAAAHAIRKGRQLIDEQGPTLFD